MTPKAGVAAAKECEELIIAIAKNPRVSQGCSRRKITGSIVDILIGDILILGNRYFRGVAHPRFDASLKHRVVKLVEDPDDFGLQDLLRTSKRIGIDKAHAPLKS